MVLLTESWSITSSLATKWRNLALLWSTLVATTLSHFSLFSAKKTKFIRFYTIFHVKQEGFLSSKIACLLLLRKPVQQKWLRFLKHWKKQCMISALTKPNLLPEILLYSQHDLTLRIYALHKITIALKFMSYIYQKLRPSYQTALNLCTGRSAQEGKAEQVATGMDHWR